MLVNRTNGEKRFYPKYTITKGQKSVSGFSSTKKSIKTIAGLPLDASYNQNIMKLFKDNELQIIRHFLDTIIDKFHTAPDNYFKNQASLLSIDK